MCQVAAGVIGRIEENLDGGKARKHLRGFVLETKRLLRILQVS